MFTQRNATSNLLPRTKTNYLRHCQSKPTFLFPEADKGLGPCAVTYEQYVVDCLKHLRNESVYSQLSESEATATAKHLKSQLDSWLSRYKNVIGKMSHDYIKNHVNANSSNPFGQFYTTYKVHKGQNEDGSWPALDRFALMSAACPMALANG